jgi:CheY-like chemotaxis protein
MTEQAAFEAAVDLKPDAILMDYRLGGGGDGFLAARRIREASDIPIIFCTAYATSLGKHLLSLPRTQTVRKPVRPSSLQKALEVALKIDGRRHEE